MIETQNIRAISLEALLEILEKGALGHLVISQALRKYAYLEKRDRAFFTRLTEGCIERKITLDYIIDQYSKVPTKKMKPVIRNILRMGAYQILYMNNIPNSAACNEAVRLAQLKKFTDLKGFVNGVLRSISREKDNISYPDQKKDKILYLSVFYSMPEWIIRKWEEQYGMAKTQQFLECSLKEKELTVRFNLSKAGKKEILSMLTAQGIEPRESFLPYAFTLHGYDSLEDIHAFAEGYLQVQDESSMLVAEACGVKEGDQILDVCAAPGGKALHLADKLNATGLVIARDLSEKKIRLIEENISRCGYFNINAEIWDATEFDPNMEKKMDIVLADLPCSGLGVMGRKNDRKYRITEQMQEDLINIQRKILSIVWKYVKPNGVLIYSTCTLNQKENEENAQWFLEHFPFEMEDLTPYLPEIVLKKEEIKRQAKKGSITLYPFFMNTDGFYFARFRRKEEEPQTSGRNGGNYATR